MVGSSRRLVLASIVLIITATPGPACPWSMGVFERPRPMPAPVWYYCVPAALPYTTAPGPVPQKLVPKVKTLAEPTPAPPSQTTVEPPAIQKRAPTVFEARSGMRTAQGIEGSPSRCKVGFWNVTGQDVTLTIDGKSRKLAKDRAVTVELERDFVWQITGREPRRERVPEEANVLEVILRP
jgi:hypothetical protein